MQWMESDELGWHTSNEEWPKRSEEWGIIIPQSGNSFGKPIIRSTIVVNVPGSYTISAFKSLIGMDYRLLASLDGNKVRRNSEESNICSGLGVNLECARPVINLWLR